MEKETFLEEEGMKNLKFNVIISRSMVIILQNARIMALTILKEKTITQKKNVIQLAFKGEEVSENMWYLDTDSSNYMCGKKNIFVELDESANGQVSFGDFSKIPVKGKSKVLVR